MKLFYKSYAPDVSAGSTTIKDDGEKRSPRKLINPLELPDGIADDGAGGGDGCR